MKLDDGVDQQQAEHGSASLLQFPLKNPVIVRFDRKELAQILSLYGFHVADGEWRDYAMDFGKDAATFSIFRRSSEQPLYRIIKNPSLARKQGQYSITAQGGLIIKRGQDLSQVLKVLAK